MEQALYPWQVQTKQTTRKYIILKTHPFNANFIHTFLNVVIPVAKRLNSGQFKSFPDMSHYSKNPPKEQ